MEMGAQGAGLRGGRIGSVEGYRRDKIDSGAGRLQALGHFATCGWEAVWHNGGRE